MQLKQRIDELFQVTEDTIKANVKKDPSTANISGQAKTPGDLEDQEKLKSGDIEVADIIDKINALRAGHSLKDKSIAISLEEYFTGLDVAERVALFTYVKALSEILSGIKPGNNAIEPDDKDPAVTMKKQGLQNSEEKAKSTAAEPAKKANVIVNKNKQGSQQQTSQPTQKQKTLPIVPKQ